MSNESDSSIPWKEIAIGAGLTLGVAGGAYLLYKSLQDDDSTPNQSIPIPVHREGKNESGVPLSRTAKQLADQAQLIKNEGNDLFKEGKYQEAIEKYTQALRILPEANVQSAATFYQNRAAANEKLENRQEVIADCTSAIEKNRSYAKAYIRRAKGAIQI